MSRDGPWAVAAVPMTVSIGGSGGHTVNWWIVRTCIVAGQPHEYAGRMHLSVSVVQSHGGGAQSPYEVQYETQRGPDAEEPQSF